ncbi:Hypothetical protein D9617_16g014720 [Elsinoe fawcettii]|nr:Hypothetical protein D9617_16g014720 [Elsinoe fawcettii]
MSIALVTTALAPGLAFSTWLSYYLQYVSLIIIYLDNPASHDLFASYVEGLPVILLPGSQKSPSLTPESRIMLRQGDNVSDAIDLLLNSAEYEHISWLLHFDMDELLYFPSRPAEWNLDNLAQGSPALHFSNHEAVPLSGKVTDPFKECTHFLLNRRGHNFIAYGNGKSAVRLKHGVKPHGPHYFRGWGMRESARNVPIEDAVLLHYPNPDFESWKRKFQHYGKFSDYWYGDEKMPNRVEFMLRSRDVVAEAEKTGNWEEAEKWFRQWTYDRDRLDTAMNNGEIESFEPVGRGDGELLSDTEAATGSAARDEL